MSSFDQIDIRVLRIFLTLVSERSVTQTSVRVGVSQPAITQALNRLRLAFGDPLLVRGPTGMQPTERALVLEREVRRFLDSIVAMQADRDDFDPYTEVREIIVTAPEYLELLMVPRLSQVLRRYAPGLTLRVRSPDSARIADWLAAGEVDFRMGWVRDPQPSIRAMPLFEDDIVVISGPHHAILDQGLTLEQYAGLAHVRLVGNGQTTSGRAIDDYIRQHGANLRVSLFAQSLVALLGALQTSDVVATVPRQMALRIRELCTVKITDFPGQLPRVTNSLYWHERTHRSALHQWFRAKLAAVMRDEASDAGQRFA